MPTPLEHRECTQTLRRLARKAGVDPVSDSSGKDKVRCMALAVLGALDDASEDHGQAARAWKAYKGTFPEWSESENSEGSD